MLKGKKVHFFF